MTLMESPLKCPKDIGLSVVRLSTVTGSRIACYFFNLEQEILYPSISVLPLDLWLSLFPFLLQDNNNNNTYIRR